MFSFINTGVLCFQRVCSAAIKPWALNLWRRILTLEARHQNTCSLRALNCKHTLHTHTQKYFVGSVAIVRVTKRVNCACRQTRNMLHFTQRALGECYHVATHSWFLITWNSKQPSHHITGMHACTRTYYSKSVKISDDFSLPWDTISGLKCG